MRDERRHGIAESRCGRLDRIQSDHAGLGGFVDFCHAGRVELIL